MVISNNESHYYLRACENVKKAGQQMNAISINLIGSWNEMQMPGNFRV